MRFLIDADLPYSLKEIFIARGLEAMHVRDVGLNSASDEEIFYYAAENSFIIVTRDLGFAEIFLKQGGKGLILVRLPHYFNSDGLKRFFAGFLKSVKPGEFSGAITVVELERYRTKKLG